MKKIVSRFNKTSLWWYLTSFWTIIVFVAIGWDFYENNGFANFTTPLLVLYIALLAIYAGDKEFERWHHLHRSTHPGELFVIAWTILIAVLFVLTIILDKPYKISGEIISAYIAVLSILAITRRSKSLYRRKK